METPPPFDRAEQAHRLERFLRWTLPLVAVFLVGELSLGIAFGDPPLRALSGVLALFGGAALLAFWLVRRGDLVASTALLAGAILVAAIASAVIQPALLPGLTIVPLLAFAVAALFLHGRALVVTAVGCWVGATLLALVALLEPAPSPLPGWLLDLLIVAVVAAITGLKLMLLVQSSGRLTAALAATRRAIADLRVAEDERRRSERLLLERQRQESLGVLAGGVAHDVNNTLTAILGNAELARLDAPTGSEQARSLDAIVEAAERASVLSRQMLAYSGHGALVLREVDPVGLVRSISGMLSELLPAHVRLHIDVAPMVPRVRADEGQLVQLLVNLVTNAADALSDAVGPDDRVTIRLAPVILDAPPAAASGAVRPLAPGTYLAIDVIDTGPGMDPEVRAHAFDPFFSTRFAGRGLGLPVVMGIVRGHRGSVSIEPRGGRGTHVRVLLPAPGAADAEPEHR